MRKNIWGEKRWNYEDLEGVGTNSNSGGEQLEHFHSEQYFAMGGGGGGLGFGDLGNTWELPWICQRKEGHPIGSQKAMPFVIC